MGRGCACSDQELISGPVLRRAPWSADPQRARRAVCCVPCLFVAGSSAQPCGTASAHQRSRVARGIGGKVFAISKARRRNFVQGQQKKRLQRLFAVSALCGPINIYIYVPSASLGGTAQKFGFAGLTDPPLSCIILAVVRATAPANNDGRQVTHNVPSISGGLTLEQSYGAMLMANQISETIKAQKKAIRDALSKLI